MGGICAVKQQTASWLSSPIRAHTLFLSLSSSFMAFCLTYKQWTFIDCACLSPLFFCAFTQVLQMYLPFCGISISNAKLFSESRKEYERSRVRQCKHCIYKNMFDYFIATGQLTGTPAYPRFMELFSLSFYQKKFLLITNTTLLLHPSTALSTLCNKQSIVSFFCGHRLCWRWSMTCLKSRLTWRRLSGRSCSEHWPCCSVSAPHSVFALTNECSLQLIK